MFYSLFLCLFCDLFSAFLMHYCRCTSFYNKKGPSYSFKSLRVPYLHHSPRFSPETIMNMVMAAVYINRVPTLQWLMDRFLEQGNDGSLIEQARIARHGLTSSGWTGSVWPNHEPCPKASRPCSHLDHTMRLTTPVEHSTRPNLER